RNEKHGQQIRDQKAFHADDETPNLATLRPQRFYTLPQHIMVNCQIERAALLGSIVTLVCCAYLPCLFRLAWARQWRVKRWDIELFRPGRFLLEELTEAVKKFDLAIFVLGQDDVTESRGSATPSLRDNVIFEAGLFTAVLGRERTFYVI